ncbi:hypothetical protein P8452_58797 [Trifolium repens]|nr:hypothetical protein P8452_58797 [Trifolium repens]
MIHVDIWGPLAVTSFNGYSYFLTIVDDHTRHTWIYLMKHKSEARQLLHNFISLIHTQYHVVIKTVRSDNGQEFNCPSYYSKLGIIHQTSCIETPQQNSIVERKHQHIMNVTRSLLFHSNLPKKFWCFAVKHAVHTINRLPTPILHNKSPFEMLHKHPPALMDLKVFGSLFLLPQSPKAEPNLILKPLNASFLASNLAPKDTFYMTFTNLKHLSLEMLFFMNTFSPTPFLLPPFKPPTLHPFLISIFFLIFIILTLHLSPILTMSPLHRQLLLLLLSLVQLPLLTLNKMFLSMIILQIHKMSLHMKLFAGLKGFTNLLLIYRIFIIPLGNQQTQ